MFALRKEKDAKKVSVHALPCKLHHNGSVDGQRFGPDLHSDSSSTAYFRGRKLGGQTIQLPDRYQGRFNNLSQEWMLNIDQGAF